VIRYKKKYESFLKIRDYLLRILMGSAVVLQITDFLRFVFKNPGRIFSYINDFFTKYMNSMQYCEETDNGFLFIQS
jgi:hypothetical protein